MNDVIDRAIKKHGAKTVYNAAYHSMTGDKQPLLDCGLNVNSIADADDIGRYAYRHMTKSQQAADYWDASTTLTKE